MIQYKISLVEILLVGIGILAPLNATMIVISLLVLLDLGAGIYKAYKKSIPISSKRMGHTISKIVFYNIAIISAYLIELYIIGSTVHLTKVVSSVIALVEFKSILENVSEIVGFDLLKKVMEVLKRKYSKEENKDQ